MYCIMLKHTVHDVLLMRQLKLLIQEGSFEECI